MPPWVTKITVFFGCLLAIMSIAASTQGWIKFLYFIVICLGIERAFQGSSLHYRGSQYLVYDKGLKNRSEKRGE